MIISIWNARVFTSAESYVAAELTTTSYVLCLTETWVVFKDTDLGTTVMAGSVDDDGKTWRAGGVATSSTGATLLKHIALYSGKTFQLVHGVLNSIPLL